MQFLKSLKTCAIGSLGAGVFLSLMSLVPRPFSREEQIGVWSGAHILSPHDLRSLLAQFSIMYTLLSLYLIGHFLMWLGYGCLIVRKSMLVGAAVIFIGFLSCLFDLSEYALRGALLKSIQWKAIPHSALIPLWWYVRELSIWIIYLGTSVIGVFFLNRSKAASFMAFLSILTIPCLYLFDLSKIWFIWLIAWHCVSAVIIWKIAAQGAEEQLN